LFLSGLFLGVNYFQNVAGTPSPVKKIYDSIQIFGGATIDKLQIENIEIDNETLTNIAISDRLIWNPTTILLAEFENNLIAGNVANLDSPVTQWQISRRESNSSVLKILGTVDVGVTEFVDFSCQQNKIYELNVACEQEILAGFYSSCRGTQEFFTNSRDDQNRVISQATLATLNPSYAPEWKSASETICTPFTMEQIVQLATEGATFMTERIKMFETLRNQVVACETIECVGEIVWENYVW